MDYKKDDVYAMIQEVLGTDDVVGHCSFWFPNNASVCNEDGIGDAGICREDNRC